MRNLICTILLLVNVPISQSQTFDPGNLLELAKRDYGYKEFERYGESFGLERLKDRTVFGDLLVIFKTGEFSILQFESNEDETIIDFYTRTSSFYERWQEELEEEGFIFQKTEEIDGNSHRFYKGTFDFSEKVTVRLTRYEPIYSLPTRFGLQINSEIKAPLVPEAKNNVPNNYAVLEESKKNIIVRDKYYWDQYAGTGYELQAIHNGDKTFSHGPSFELIYLFFLKTYFKECGDYLPEGSPGFETITTSHFQDGSTSENVTSLIRMKEKFVDKYKEFSNSSYPNLLKPDSYNFTLNLFIDIQREILEMYSKEGCSSGFMRQFEENLYRIANGLKTVQEDGRTYDFTADEPTKTKNKKTLFSACLEYQQKIKGFSLLPSEKKWCRCLSDSFTQRLSAFELETYIKDYVQFYKDKGVPPTENKDNSWENYEIWARCQRR